MGKKKKEEGGKLLTFFCLAATLRGTTPAMVKADTLKRAHWIYTHSVVVSGIGSNKKRRSGLWKDSGVSKNGRVYWDGEIFVEQMKIWKRVKGYPVACIGMDLDIEFKSGSEPYEE